jgi:ribosomal protein S11
MFRNINQKMALLSPSIPNPDSLKYLKSMLKVSTSRSLGVTLSNKERKHLLKYSSNSFKKKPFLSPTGSVFVRIRETYNNYTVLIRTPSGKTLGSWRGGYSKERRKSRASLKLLTDKVESTILRNKIKDYHVQFRGTANLYFKVARRTRFKTIISSVSYYSPTPHNGPRGRKLRTV